MDSHIRELERKYVESNSEEDAEALLRARVRGGDSPPVQFLIETIIQAVMGAKPQPSAVLKFLDGSLDLPHHILSQVIPNIHAGLSGLADELDNVSDRLHNLENQL